MSQFIITTSPTLRNTMLNELNAIDASCRCEKEFGYGIFLVSFAADQAAVTAEIVRERHTFIKHVHPVQAEGRLRNQLSGDLEMLKGGIGKLRLEAGRPFSVQVRTVENITYTAKDLEVLLGRHIEQTYSIDAYFDDYDIPDDIGQQIIGLLIFRDAFFMGLGSAAESLHPVSDPCRIFSRGPVHVSRAEFKLREALKIIGYRPAPASLAIDIGAAPGGWSFVLAERGMTVIAIDPADLDGPAADHPNIRHLKMKVEHYTGSEPADLVVNDMNMDPTDSAAAVLTVGRDLKPGGLLVMTIKLPDGTYQKQVADVIEILSPQFECIDVRCLFYNRREVTAFFRRVGNVPKVVGHRTIRQRPQR